VKMFFYRWQRPVPTKQGESVASPSLSDIDQNCSCYVYT